MGIQKTYAQIVGIILTLMGIWGFFTPIVIGIFSVNTFLSLIYLVIGLIGIYVGIWGTGRIYNLSIGWIFIILAILGFIPEISSFLTKVTELNIADTILHFVLGIVSLGVYYATT